MLQHPEQITAEEFSEPKKTIVSRKGIGSAMLIEQAVTTCCRRLSATDPALALVKQGRKIVNSKGQTTIAEAGTVVVFPGSFEADITNETGNFGHYRALLISFAPEILNGPTKSDRLPLTAVTSFADDDLNVATAMEAALEAIRDHSLPANVAQHRVTELLLWLEGQGIFFAAPAPINVVDSVKRLITAAPATNWQSPAIATNLGMSEATLRRRLAKHKQSLSKLILETRMVTALAMLQAGDQPIVQISYAVGYNSPSRFALRFKQRFGFAPSELRKRSA